MLKTALKITAVILIVLTGAALGYLYKTNKDYQESLVPVGPGPEQLFTVESGWGVKSIGNALESAGLIRKSTTFSKLAKNMGVDTKLQAGDYFLAPSMSCEEIINEMLKGHIITQSFTIPEGWNLKQICNRFVEEQICTEEDFWNEVENGEFDFPFLEGTPAGKTRLEGYLFPDTYTIKVGESIHSVFNRMLNRFNEVVASIGENHSGLSMHDAIILASIVQNEIKADEERPLAASVFLNRIDRGMLLQSCATVQYVLGEPKENLTYADMAIDDPYNTYVYAGLPPAPISCPGKASINGVFNASETKFLYFVLKEDGSGTHYWNETLEGHNADKQKSK